MKIFGKILKIIFSLLFIVSICLNIIIAFSTTNKLAFKDSADARNKIMYNSTIAFNNYLVSDGFSITSTNKSENSTETTIDKIHCKWDSTLSVLEKCSMVSVLYDKDDNVIKRSYFPGDGYKYTVDNNGKIKSVFPDVSLTQYASSILTGWKNSLGYIQYANDTTFSNGLKISYKTNVNFSFNSFSIIKNINCSLITEAKTTNYKFKVNGKDQITSIYTDATGDSTLDLSYKKSEITFPSFEGFNLK